MEVTVNQQNYLVQEDCSIHVLLSDVLRRSLLGVAVAINESIVPKTQWEKHILKSGDQIIIIQATQGG